MLPSACFSKTLLIYFELCDLFISLVIIIPIALLDGYVSVLADHPLMYAGIYLFLDLI